MKNRRNNNVNICGTAWRLRAEQIKSFNNLFDNRQQLQSRARVLQYRPSNLSKHCSKLSAIVSTNHYNVPLIFNRYLSLWNCRAHRSYIQSEYQCIIKHLTIGCRTDFHESFIKPRSNPCIHKTRHAEINENQLVWNTISCSCLASLLSLCNSNAISIFFFKHYSLSSNHKSDFEEKQCVKKNKHLQ